MIDVIGTIYTQPVVSADSTITVPPQPIEGWHVNTHAPIVGWEAYSVTPATPRRVFAGHDTYFYSFSNEAEFKHAAHAAGVLTDEMEGVL